MSTSRTLSSCWDLVAAGLALVFLPCAVQGTELDLSDYQRDDGAITTHYQGDFVDPYFALKALLSAKELGMDISAPAHRWINWMLSQPTTDGLYGRYCMIGNGVWQQCKTADADDSLLALWLQLLHVSAPADGLPKAWRASARLSFAALERLYDVQLGGYVISPSKHVALLMDNAEVLDALRTVAAKKAIWGERTDANHLRRQANKVEKNLVRLFPPKPDGLLRHTSENEGSDAFYPHVVAQLYPLLHGLPRLLKKPAISYREWMRRYRNEWLTFTLDDYPWGLMALVAQRRGDIATVNCWVRLAEPLRHSARWNVLEEALWQGLVTHANPDTPCTLH